MRIAFDLDETLVREYIDFPLEPDNRIVDHHLSQECLRAGARQLCEELLEAGHELWVYTFSYRSEDQVIRLFRKYGIELHGIINRATHDEMVEDGEAGYDGSLKYPPAFGIDLLIDNLEENGLEGHEWDFEVLIIEETDTFWVKRVWEKIRTLEAK